MIVKFFSAQSKTKKYASGGTGVQDYLLGKNFIDGQNPSRENAKVLQGDPNLITELINGLNFSVPYCSGCLSFDGDESERVTEAMKIELMEEFEKTLFANHNDRISGYWVEHTDKTDPNNGKQRLELNFVFANVDLVTGKFLPSYYHQADLGRVNAYKEIMNYKHDLTDPANRLAISTRIGNTHPAKLKDLKGTIDEQLTAAVNEGKVNDRADVLNFVKELGYEIVGSKKGSISIKNPDPSNSRNVRLEGAYYTKDFDGKAYLADKTRLESTANPQMTKYQVYKASKLIDIHESQIQYDWGMARRQEFLDKRYPAPTPPPADALVKKPTDEEVQRYANNFRAALTDIANTRSRILEIRTANQSVIAGIRKTDHSIEVTKNDIGNTDSDIENAKQRIADTERVIKLTKSGIADTERILGESQSITDTIHDGSMRINIKGSDNLLPTADGQSDRINRAIELRKRKISESVARLNAPKPPTPFDSKPEPKSYNKVELWKNPALRSPADLFRFRFNLLDNTTARLVPTRQNADQLYNDVLELPELMDKYHNLKNQQNFGIYDTYINFREIPLKWQRLDVLPEAKPILNFIITGVVKNDGQIMHDYENSTTQDFLAKYADDIKDLDKTAINSIIKHYASKHSEPREFAEIEPAPRVAREPELEQADRLRSRLRGP